MQFSLGYWNCTSILTIYRGISCRLTIFLSRIGNKHGFFSINNSISHGCEDIVLPISVRIIKKIWKLNFRALATMFKWSLCHLPVLKSYDYLQIKRNLGFFSLFTTTFLAKFSLLLKLVGFNFIDKTNPRVMNFCLQFFILVPGH